MDSDNSNRSSDVLRNVVMGRVMEVGRFSDANITFQGEEMPEEFTTKHLKPWDEVSFTAELASTTVQQFIDKIYKECIVTFMSQMDEQFSKIEEACICYANPDDHGTVEFIKSLYETTSLRTLNDVIYTKLIEKGRILLAPVSSIYGNLASYLYGAQETTTIHDEIEKRSKPPVRDIPWLKKQLKHCKNPMERKQLEREFNAAFREKKRRRKK